MRLIEIWQIRMNMWCFRLISVDVVRWTEICLWMGKQLTGWFWLSADQRLHWELSVYWIFWWRNWSICLRMKRRKKIRTGIWSRFLSGFCRTELRIICRWVENWVNWDGVEIMNICAWSCRLPIWISRIFPQRQSADILRRNLRILWVFFIRMKLWHFLTLPDLEKARRK